MIDREQLADFLRLRRAAMQPEDAGLAAGERRRTAGLRREEVAALARALRLSQDERDHMFRLAGHTPPSRAFRSTHVSPALLRVLDNLDVPAQVNTNAGEVLVQNDGARPLIRTAHTCPQSVSIAGNPTSREPGSLCTRGRRRGVVAVSEGIGHADRVAQPHPNTIATTRGHDGRRQA